MAYRLTGFTLWAFTAISGTALAAVLAVWLLDSLPWRVAAFVILWLPGVMLTTALTCGTLLLVGVAQDALFPKTK